MLDGFQAGLSWSTILKKREAFRQAFARFDPERVARFTERDVVRLLANPGIVRSRAKIEATIGGARAYLAMAEAGEDFSTFVWNMAGGAHDSQQESRRAGQDTSLGRNVQGASSGADSNSSARSSSMLGCRRPAR